MLKLCPECCLQVSDKAAACPHCGYPLKSKSSLPPKKKKHMRLPNGFGQISEVRGRNLRKPFRAMVTAGRTDEGKPIVCPLRPVAYFETYNEAYKALMKYNAHPFDLSNKTTMQDLFDMWLTTKEKKVDSSTISRYKRAWAYSSSIHTERVYTRRTVEWLISELDKIP